MSQSDGDTPVFNKQLNPTGLIPRYENKKTKRKVQKLDADIEKDIRSFIEEKTA
jgi:hypothetical protein